MWKRLWGKFWNIWWLSGPVCGAALGIAGGALMGHIHYKGQEREREVWDANAPQRELDKVPRKVSEGESCEVWTFNPDGLRWRYFTKCGSAETTTDNAWVECSGRKANTCVARSEPLSVKGN